MRPGAGVSLAAIAPPARGRSAQWSEALLRRSRLNVSSATNDRELAHVLAVVEDVVTVRRLSELKALLIFLAGLDRPSRLRQLDLIGHSEAGSCLLELGGETLDGSRECVVTAARELALHRVFERLGLVEVRLIGCRTAATEAGRETITRLQALLPAVTVFGAVDVVDARHFARGGYQPRFDGLLVAPRLRGELTRPAPRSESPPRSSA